MKKRIAVLSLASLLLLVFFLTVQNYYSKENTTNRFFEAIENEDSKAVSELVRADTDQLTVTENSIKPFLRYLQKHDQQRNKLKEQVLTADKENEKTNDQLVVLKPGKKKWIFFRMYQFEVKSRFIKLKADGKLQNAEITAGTETLTANKNGEYGPLLIGEHPLTIAFADPFGNTIEVEKTLDLMKEDETITINQLEETVKDKTFQDKVAAEAVHYYQTYGEALTNNLDVEKIQNSTSEHKRELAYLFEYVKTLTTSYDYTFNGLVLNAASLKLTHTNEGWKINVDGVVDQESTVQLSKTDNFALQPAEKSKDSVILTLVYDEKKNSWLIEKENYETYEKDSAKWTDKIEKVIEDPTTYKWEKSEIDSVGIPI
ncbi:TcaA second domain-containing protein [Carnobacterium sp.]|uniref:TcaA second domain-containing protein n=1 Tax=Carnobacterium sp. TaxID=48221 RepID=UPI0028AF8445|nr:hypothetical protein [Carnobacterium sp.]